MEITKIIDDYKTGTFIGKIIGIEKKDFVSKLNGEEYSTIFIECNVLLTSGLKKMKAKMSTGYFEYLCKEVLKRPSKSLLGIFVTLKLSQREFTNENGKDIKFYEIKYLNFFKDIEYNPLNEMNSNREFFDVPMKTLFIDYYKYYDWAELNVKGFHSEKEEKVEVKKEEPTELPF